MGTPYQFGKVEPRGYVQAVAFQPHIRLSPKSGHEFAAELSEIIGPHKADIREGRWKFTQSEEGGGREAFEVIVDPGSIQIVAAFPTRAPESLET